MSESKALEGLEVIPVKRQCTQQGCSKRPNYGAFGSNEAERCKEHALADHVDVMNKRCTYSNCDRQPSYGTRGSGRAERCKEHAPSDYIDVKNRRCSESGCEKQPSYGYRESKRAKWCKKHAPTGCIDITTKRCSYLNCETIPTYGIRGSTKSERCKEHAPANYIDVKNRHCSYSNCDKRPSYGTRESRIAERCKKHAPDDYVNVVSKLCSHTNCEKHPCYGDRKIKRAERCKEHALANFINVKNKSCSYSNCDKQPSYGTRGSAKAERCKEHAPDDFIDVVHKLCTHPNCEKRPSYGIPSYLSEYCAKHKKPGMVAHPTKYKDGYVECSFCLVKIHYSQNYCKGCQSYITEGKTTKRLQKEHEIKGLLEENKIEFTHDSIVKGGCSKRRPDFILRRSWGNIIIEVDEHQHNRKNYSCECEISRMKEIYFDIGEPNLLFIRYNPDSYKTSSGSSFIKRRRHEYLIKTINEIESFSGLGVSYLFYDLFTHHYIEVIDPYENVY